MSNHVKKNTEINKESFFSKENNKEEIKSNENNKRESKLLSIQHVIFMYVFNLAELAEYLEDDTHQVNSRINLKSLFVEFSLLILPGLFFFLFILVRKLN